VIWESVNTLDAKYFINEVFRLNRSKYFEICDALTANSNFFPDKKEIEANININVGEEFSKRLFVKRDGSDNPHRRTTLFNIKNKFKIAYNGLIGTPLPPKHYALQKIFEKAADGKFNEPILTLDPKEREITAAYCFHTLSHLQKIVWIDCSILQNNDELLTRINDKCTLVCGDAAIAFSSINEVVPFLIESNVKLVFENFDINRFNGVKEKFEEVLPFALQRKKEPTIIFIRNEVDEIVREVEIENERITDISYPAAIQSRNTPALRKNRTSLLVVSIIFLLGVFFVFYASDDEPKLNIKLLNYSDEVVCDYYTGGVQIDWSIGRKKLHLFKSLWYNTVKTTLAIPDSAVELRLTNGSNEIYPELISLNNISTDTLNVFFFRKIRLYDKIKTEIRRASAQRWFVFEIPKPANVKFLISRTDSTFSPQAAIYGDRFSKLRIAGGFNFAGVNRIDSVYTFLSPGKYFLKVRGYDNSTGRFDVSWAE